MYKAPSVPEDQLREVLDSEYGLSVETLTFLPLGADANSFVYRVQTDGTSHFLKLRTGAGFSPQSLMVPRYLSDWGVQHVFAPLPTIGGALWATVGDCALTLYPYIEGRDGAGGRLSAQQWREFGALMRQVHTVQLPADVTQTVPRETFVPRRRDLIENLEVLISRNAFSSAAQEELAAFWRVRRDQIRAIVERADELSERLRQSMLPVVLCHADMHPWNVLIDATGDFFLVDWDETIFAPKERDLMFVIGGIGGDGVGRPETDEFLAGYGDAAIDRLALAYYRYAWAVQDIAAFGEQVLLLPGQGEPARQEALRYFVGQFAPGNVVSLAMASDHDWR